MKSLQIQKKHLKIGLYSLNITIIFVLQFNLFIKYIKMYIIS